MYLVEDMNTLDDCDLLEKVVDMTNVHEHNSVTVSIKVQQFRSRSAKYVYYNCTRVCVTRVLFQYLLETFFRNKIKHTCVLFCVFL